jgi:hypothetical protein
MLTVGLRRQSMTTTTPKSKSNTTRSLYLLAGIILAMSLAVIYSCSNSSDTRTQAQAAANADNEFVVRALILSPQNGDTIAWFLDATTGEFTTPATFSASATGGTSGTYTFTWVVEGPNTSVLSSGETPDIVLAEDGILKITLTVVDSNGLSDSTSVSVSSEVGGITTFRLRITQPIATTYSLGETVRTTVEPSGGSGNYAVLWEPSLSTVSPATSTSLSQVWTPASTGSYTFDVTVTDLGTGEILKSSVTVTVN